MSNAVAVGVGRHSHRTLRLGLVMGIIVLLAMLGTYYVTEKYVVPQASGPGGTQTIIVYHNSTVYENTTQNVTTPIFHNSTVWQNSTIYRNGTSYNVTTIYVNTTEVVMVPVVNVTGLAWTIDANTAGTGELTATLVAPTGPGFAHSYPLGTVMWIEANLTNHASSSARVTLSTGSPFVFVDSQPSVPQTIPANSTLTIEISIGVPYAPGEYTLELTATVT